MHSIRKPRVFLSHSKKDVAFIRRLEADLRAAQCDPWIDEVELRAGLPWLDQIFGSGIPSCEVVLCYFTANSAESAVFMQELDARLIERLHNARVSLLLYVASADLRSRLRLDLQRLQVPELNDQNYATALPKVVAEVWRCYAESLVQTSLDSERVKRLEAELRIKELEGEASASVFTASEQAEFKVIWSRIDRKHEIFVVVTRKEERQIGGILELQPDEHEASPSQQPQMSRFQLNVGLVFRSTILTQKFQPSISAARDRVRTDILLHLGIDSNDYGLTFEMPIDIEAELLRFGFVQRQYAPTSSSEHSFIRMRRQPFKLMFTSKFDRFGFWVEHTFGLPEMLATVVQPCDA